MMKRGPEVLGTVTVDETAAEFLRAQEVARPESVEELLQASGSSSAEIETMLARFDRLLMMKERREGDEDKPIELPAYDAWVDASLDLDEAFIEENEGALGRLLIELVSLDTAAFELRKAEAQKLLGQTGNIALRVYSLVHLLVTLGFAGSRMEAVEKLSTGELVKSVRVNGVSITPRRRTVIGLLRDLDARLPVGEQTNIWTLEVAPELPSLVMISDPFLAGDKDLDTYWTRRVVARREVRSSKEASILSISGDKTVTVISELENIRDRAEDEVLRDAAGCVAQWLDGKRIYYQDPDQRDFELYHLGMEDPQVLMDVLRSLDVIKHFDPELFFELLGIDPSEGGRSMYFGSFLHKALYNTQRNIDASAAELGTMAISTMMRQLLTVDDQVQTYAAVVSQESLKAMAGEVKKSVDAALTPASKAQTLMMMMVPYSHMAIDAEVRRQLDAFREASPENMVEELRRRIDDIEHPLKLAEYIGQLPRTAEANVLVMKELRRLFGNIRFDAVREQCQNRRPEYLKMLYDRIPLIDESREDLGFTLRIKVAIRDAITVKDVPRKRVRMQTSIEVFVPLEGTVKTAAEQFLDDVLQPGAFKEDFEAIKDQFGLVDRWIAGRFSYASRRDSLVYTTAMRSSVTVMRSCEDAFLRFENEADRSFYAGQMFIAAAKEGPVDRFFSIVPFNDLERYQADLTFLSVIAHPQGKEVAFKYFDKFCEIIPPERMLELLGLDRTPVRDFVRLFQEAGPSVARPYLSYLRDQLPTVEWLFVTADPFYIDHMRPEHFPALIKISRVLSAGHTPWEIQTGYRSSPTEEFRMELFDVYQAVKRAYLNAGLDSYSVEKCLRNPDVDPPTEDQLRGMRACYEGPQTSFGSDALDTRALIAHIRTYFLRGKIDLPNEESIFIETVRKKILR